MLSAKFLAILPALASLANSLDDNYWGVTAYKEDGCPAKVGDKDYDWDGIKGQELFCTRLGPTTTDDGNDEWTNINLRHLEENGMKVSFFKRTTDDWVVGPCDDQSHLWDVDVNGCFPIPNGDSSNFFSVLKK